MRGKLAKILRQEAGFERATERDVTETGWVQKKSGAVVVSPYSLRALYLKLKDRLQRVRSGGAPLTAEDERQRDIVRTTKKRAPKGSASRVRIIPKPKLDGPAIIEKPLMLILQHCQPAVEKDDFGRIIKVTPHELYTKARRAANRGDGETVKRIAYQFA